MGRGGWWRCRRWGGSGTADRIRPFRQARPSRLEVPFVVGETNANAISSADAGIGADSSFVVTGLDNDITAVRVGFWPSSMASRTIGSAVYTPFATASVAGTSTTVY